MTPAGGRYCRGVQLGEIHHVSLNVSDVERALGFYRDLIGLTEVPRPELSVAGVWLDAGGDQQVHLIVTGVPDDLGQHVAFRVDDLDRAIDELRSAGLEVPDARPVGDSTIRQTFVHDPDGNRLELTQLG